MSRDVWDNDPNNPENEVEVASYCRHCKMELYKPIGYCSDDCYKADML